VFSAIGSFVTRFRWLVVVAWAVTAVAFAALAPSLADVGSADETTFLPKEAESMEARAVLARAFPDEAAPGTATVVFSREGGLTDADRAYIDALPTWATTEAPAELRDYVRNVVTLSSKPHLKAMFESADGSTQIATVNLDVASFQEAANIAIDVLRTHFAETAPVGLAAHVTGSAGIGADYLRAIVAGTDRTTIITILLVVLVLLLIYRAPLAALVPLLTIGAAFLVSRGTLGFLAASGWKISTLLDSFIVVLVFGVGTDYTIFLISRFREELSRGDRPTAARATVTRIGAVIAASAATVVVGLSSMAVASFGMIQSIGPALAITIVITLVAGLTLTPALLVIFGRPLFWPRHPKEDDHHGERGVWGWIASGITRRPLLVSAVVLAALLIPVVVLPGIKSSADTLADLPKDSDARIGFELFASKMDKGRLMPITVLVDAPGSGDMADPKNLAALASLTKTLAAVPGVLEATSLISTAGDGSVEATFKPSAMLTRIAGGLALLSSPQAVAAVLGNAEATGQLTSGGAWIEALGREHPELASDPSYTALMTDMAALEAALTAVAATGGAATDPGAIQAVVDIAARLQAEASTLAASFAARPGDDYMVPRGLPGDAGTGVDRLVAAYRSPDGTVARLYVIPEDDPYSTQALATVTAIRRASDGRAADFGEGARIVVGGAAADQADIQTTIQKDFERVAILTILGVLLVLIVLLRALIAPLFLVGTVLLSYVTTLHLAGFIFQDLLGHAGATFFLPLLVFVLLVALGADYNIFVTSRIREESETRPIRDGIRIASARTGAIVTSAGVILAGTFAAMMIAPLQVLFQVGAAVAMGVLLDTFIVRSLLVPALTAVFGDWSWWPSGPKGIGPLRRRGGAEGPGAGDADVGPAGAASPGGGAPAGGPGAAAGAA
jgi:RND superfamily putative drug exporter